jgi:hypothetical protein
MEHLLHALSICQSESNLTENFPSLSKISVILLLLCLENGLQLKLAYQKLQIILNIYYKLFFNTLYF